MKDAQSISSRFEKLYSDFNNRDIEAVISQMTPDVKWANGMEGGYVEGHDGVRSYWTRQFGMVSSNVTPLDIDVEKNIVRVVVKQVVNDLSGTPLADQIVVHRFVLQNGKIACFDIGDADQPSAP